MHSHRPTVKVFYRNEGKVNAFETPNIDGRHRIAVWIIGLGVRVYAACLAEMVLDDMLVESVRTNICR